MTYNMKCIFDFIYNQTDEHSFTTNTTLVCVSLDIGSTHFTYHFFFNYAYVRMKIPAVPVNGRTNLGVVK